MLTGEHIYPWMFEEYGALAPLRGAADALAKPSGRACTTRTGCGANEVPAAAVDLRRGHVRRASLLRGDRRADPGLRPWITNEYEHDGLRADGERILGRLIDLARGRA